MKDFDSVDTQPWKEIKSQIKSVTFGSGVTTVGKNAFNGYSSITSISFDTTVKTINENAFKGCTGITKIVFGAPDEYKQHLQYLDSTSHTDTHWYTIEYSFEPISWGHLSIGPTSFSLCTNLVSMTLPFGVSKIDYAAFSGDKKLTTISIPNSATYLGQYAFSGCTLINNVSIGNGITSIGDHAFYGCTGLTTMSIENAERDITFGANALPAGCSVTYNPTKIYANIAKYAEDTSKGTIEARLTALESRT